MCDAWLLVDEFPCIQVTKDCPVKTYTKVGPKHSLVALEGKKKQYCFFNTSITSVKMHYKNNSQLLL